MLSKFDNQIYIQERENFDGKKEKILTFNCRKCSYSNGNIFNNEKCTICFLKALYSTQNSKISFLSLNDIEINFYKYNALLDYFNHLKTIRKTLQKIEGLRNKKCEYKGFHCKTFDEEFFNFSLKKEKYYDPICIFEIILKKLNYFQKILNYDAACIKCVKSFEYQLLSLFKILNKLKIIRKYLKFKKQIISSPFQLSFYSDYFSDFQLNVKAFKPSKSITFSKNLVEVYKIGDDLFKILIHKIPNEFENFYEIELSFESKSEQTYFLKIINDVEKNLDFLKIDRFFSLEELIELYKNEAMRYITSKYKFAKQKMRKVAFLATLQRLNLQKLFPLLIDDYIEEIFLDSPNDKIYINHQEYGRCRTKIKFNIKEIERIKTFLRLYSGKNVDYTNPSIKLVIKNKYFNCRFAIDIEPVNLNSFSLDIRKLNKNIFTIQDLLKNETLSPVIAAYLYYNILKRANITVTGETNTGKTTLINVLDLLVPKDFRKIYIESTIESLNQSKFERHQLKFRVDQLESLNQQKFSKQNQIKKLLHRTPDIIYLGEILTKEEAEAMFHCLAAGLRGFQTIHCNDLESLVNRLIFHFKINSSCLKDLDLLILMRKLRDKRKIVFISEINHENKTLNDIYRHLFIYDPNLNKWNLLSDLFNTNTIKKLRQIEYIDEKSFNSYMKIYEDIFEFLFHYQKMSLKELISLFDRISYFSFISLKNLENFWHSWKNSRSLNS